MTIKLFGDKARQLQQGETYIVQKRTIEGREVAELIPIPKVYADEA